ncbi:MAG: hypothetical protein JWM96_547 [Alphaproteobacteria bacterium]|nr:hypothetical protein [Alphaproteobacteria bacterium]
MIFKSKNLSLVLPALLVLSTCLATPVFAATERTQRKTSISSSHKSGKTSLRTTRNTARTGSNSRIAARSDGSINDPIEPFNRAVFGFNRFVDYIVINPVTKAYTFVTPTFVQHGVTSFLSNLGQPIVLLNTALQGDWQGFSHTMRRFVMNSTFGVAGLYDLASQRRMPLVDADFGQTLGKWGVGHGFFLMLPILGPSSGRDATGRVVDTLADPYNIAFTASDTEWPIYARAGLTVVDARARYGDEIDRINKTAVDPYVTFRSIYSQRRAYMVQDRSANPYGKQDAYSQAENQ